MKNVYPICFPSPDAWKEWQRANRRCAGQARATAPCADCTKAYMRRMFDEGRCQPIVAEALTKVV